MKKMLTKVVALVVVCGLAACCWADWNPGDPFKMHHPQEPKVFGGWDVCLHEQQLADDFMCTETGPITDIHFWVSWTQDQAAWGNIRQWKISIWDNSGPPTPGGPSSPGMMLWSWNGNGNWQIRPYAQGQQGWHCPLTGQTIFPDHQQVWQINITHIPMMEAFHQVEGQIYWLVIHAEADFWPPAVGWKQCQDQQRWRSCALWQAMGSPMPWQPIQPWEETMDLAFVITSDYQPPTLDFGDAPRPYPTLLANNGARHALDGMTFMGNGVDAEPDGIPSPLADGDDLNMLIDDEDGVTFTSALTPGLLAGVDVVASVNGVLNAWVDFDQNGSWADPGEQIFVGKSLNAGLNNLSFIVPAGALPGPTFARFRFSRNGIGTYDGFAPDGEVEDYRVEIGAPLKWIQPPDLSPFGIDVNASDVPPPPCVLADDFLCSNPGKITKIVVWGSWKHDIGDPRQVAFSLSFHKDIPAGPNFHSRPGDLLWLRNFTPGEFTVDVFRDNILEGWWNPWDPQSYIFPGDTVCWMYTFIVPSDQAFHQLGTSDEPIVYWLDVQAHPIGPVQGSVFGWKTSLAHWNDDAVYGLGMEPYLGPWNELRYPPGHELYGQSIDLAFGLDDRCQTCLGDLDASGDVTFDDLLALLDLLEWNGWYVSVFDPAWNPCADMDGSGDLTFDDLLLLLDLLEMNGYYVPCP